VNEPAGDAPGTIVEVTKQSLKVSTGNGLLELREIQTANSKRMPIGQFLAGHRIVSGETLGAAAS
jgi:methionyl-tRNA formyltransferase